MESEALARQLAHDLKPVRRLRRPALRLAGWIAVALPAVLLAAFMMGLRPDLGALLMRPAFIFAEAAALLTAVLGIYAAVCAGLPDQPGWKLWLPVGGMALWLGVLGKQCIDVWLRLGPGGLSLSGDLVCLPVIALIGFIPALLITLMLRRTSGFRATHACLCGGIGAASLAAAALRLCHAEDAALMVLVWQVGSVLLLSLIAGAIGRRLLPARATRFSPPGA